MGPLAPSPLICTAAGAAMVAAAIAGHDHVQTCGESMWNPYRLI
jgi:hypothetical protein